MPILVLELVVHHGGPGQAGFEDGVGEVVFPKVRDEASDGTVALANALDPERADPSDVVEGGLLGFLFFFGSGRVNGCEPIQRGLHGGVHGGVHVVMGVVGIRDSVDHVSESRGRFEAGRGETPAPKRVADLFEDAWQAFAEAASGHVMEDEKGSFVLRGESGLKCGDVKELFEGVAILYVGHVEFGDIVGLGDEKGFAGDGDFDGSGGGVLQVQDLMLYPLDSTGT